MWPTFRDEKLERRFRAEQSEKRRPLDDIAVMIHLAPILLAIVQAWRTKPALVDKLTLPASLSTQLFLFGLSRLRPKVYTAHRTPLLVFQKLFSAFLSCSLGVIMTKPDTSWLHFVQFEILTYGKGVPLLLTGLVLPVHFRELVFVQSAITGFNILFNPSVCQNFFERVPENQAKYAQASVLLDRIFGNPALFRGLGLGKALDPTCASGHTNCLRILAFTQILFGFILPSLIMYAFECKARLAFQRAHFQIPQKPARSKRTLWWLSVGLGAANLYIGLVLIWHLLGWTLSTRKLAAA